MKNVLPCYASLICLMAMILTTSCNNQRPVAFGNRKFYPDKATGHQRLPISGKVSEKELLSITAQDTNALAVKTLGQLTAMPSQKSVTSRFSKPSWKQRLALNLLKRKLGQARSKADLPEASLEVEEEQKEPTLTGLLFLILLASSISIIGSVFYLLKLIFSVANTNNGTSPIGRILGVLALIILLLIVLGLIVLAVLT